MTTPPMTPEQRARQAIYCCCLNKPCIHEGMIESITAAINEAVAAERNRLLPHLPRTCTAADLREAEAKAYERVAKLRLVTIEVADLLNSWAAAAREGKVTL